MMNEIEGTKDIVMRLASLEQYSSARFEMEVGLSLLLGGFDIQFIQANQSGPSADISVKNDIREFVVEVSTLNRTQNEIMAMEMSNWAASVSFTSGMTAGGMVNGMIYSPKLASWARDEVSSALERAKSSHSVQEATVPGFARVWVAPRDLANQMPAGVAGRFSLTNAPEQDLQVRLVKKIKDKMNQISKEGQDSVLVLYSDVAGWQSLEELFGRPRSEIEVVINTIPSLMGLSLAGFGGILRPLETFQHEPQSKNSMSLFMSEIGIQEPYAFLTWTNRYSAHHIPPGVFQAFQNYPLNLKRLPSLKA
ncbi:MAG: hypothetical protein JRM77_10345 [Nitrososphaerota archaeon]|jgi:hypothetical protein|nr:hypothetical protein [Nitrososphaerota archaeon]